MILVIAVIHGNLWGGYCGDYSSAPTNSRMGRILVTENTLFTCSIINQSSITLVRVLNVSAIRYLLVAKSD